MDSSKKAEILLVEDNASDAELTLRVLRKFSSVTTHVARDGAEALDFLFGQILMPESAIIKKPKFILLDLNLPKLNGLEVLRKIKSDPRTSSIPVVIFTSSKEDRDLIESYQNGANSYIPKPVAFENFVSTVSQLGKYWLELNQPVPQ